MLSQLQNLCAAVARRRLWAALVLAALAVLAWSIVIPLIHTGRPPDWTGFGPIPGVPASTRVSLAQPAKTLWDWLQLLAALLIPVVVAYAGLAFTRQQSRTERKIADDRLQEERRIADDRQKESVLETYFDRVSQLLLDQGARGLKDRPEVQAVARARTVTTLRRLDGARNGFLLRFLRESRLMEAHNVSIDLSRADISGADLGGADLHGANLSGVDLSRANLRASDLSEANMAGADVSAADLRGAHLTNAHLYEATLIDANLSETYMREANAAGANLRAANLCAANLISADLSGANLRRATLRGANLVGANLNGAYLCEADLRGATLRGADLSDADLTGASISDEQVREAASYQGLIRRDEAPLHPSISGG